MAKNCLNCRELNECGTALKVKKNFLKNKAGAYLELAEDCGNCPDYAENCQDSGAKNENG